MKVIQKVVKDEWGGDWLCEISTPKISISFSDMTECPEDATLCRDLSDIYNVPSMLREAYEAGKNGEEFILEEEEVAYGEDY